jgi:hypothetical protein
MRSARYNGTTPMRNARETRQATELGSKGGRRRAVYRPGDLREFGAPKTAADLRDLLADSIVEIRAGKLESARRQCNWLFGC